MISLGFVRGLSPPCLFHHPQRDIDTVVHGDDFTNLGEENELKWLTDKLKEHFSIKDRGTLGPDVNDLKEIRLLNRIIAWESDGIRYEADQRHGEILIDVLDLKEAKGVDTPGIVVSQSELEKT